MAIRVIDRCNLTVLEAPGQEDWGAFPAAQESEVTASLPCYLEDNVNRQRGRGVFKAGIRALRALNRLDYGKEGSGLVLNLVYNPQGPALPPPQQRLEAEYKQQLYKNDGIVFNQLLSLANNTHPALWEPACWFPKGFLKNTWPCCGRPIRRTIWSR